MAEHGSGRRAAAARKLDRHSPMPLWAQLRADLRRRLAAGGFGEVFPGELALVAEYEVSRHTVRTALQQLRADGIVVAERGRRPRLAGQTAITQPLGAMYSLFASVESAGLSQTSIVRSRDVRADGVVADRLGLEASVPLFRLERLRLAGEEPLALDTVWLPADIAAPLLRVRLHPHRSVRRADRPHGLAAGERAGAYPRGGAHPGRAAPPGHPAIHRGTGYRPDRLLRRQARGVAAHSHQGRQVLIHRRVLVPHRLPAHARRPGPGWRRHLGGRVTRRPAAGAGRALPGRLR